LSNPLIKPPWESNAFYVPVKQEVTKFMLKNISEVQRMGAHLRVIDYDEILFRDSKCHGKWTPNHLLKLLAILNKD